MLLKRVLVLEVVVAGLTLAAAGAFAHASVHGQAPLFDAVSAQADALGRKMFRDECITCHEAATAAAPQVREAKQP
jgi:cytochrome c5